MLLLKLILTTLNLLYLVSTMDNTSTTNWVANLKFQNMTQLKSWKNFYQFNLKRAIKLEKLFMSYRCRTSMNTSMQQFCSLHFKIMEKYVVTHLSTPRKIENSFCFNFAPTFSCFTVIYILNRTENHRCFKLAESDVKKAHFMVKMQTHLLPFLGYLKYY